MLVLYFIFLANIFCTSSFHGASFSNSFWAVLAFGRFSNKKFKYLYTFRSYAFAISIIVKQIALALAPSTESQNNQFFLPTVIGRIAFSLRLLLRLHLPSSRYVISESFRFRMYITAWSRRLPLTGVCASSHDKKASMTGFSSLRRRFFFVPEKTLFHDNAVHIQTAYHNTKLPERQDLYNLFHDLSGSLPEDIGGYVHNNSSVFHPSTGWIHDSRLP